MAKRIINDDIYRNPNFLRLDTSLKYAYREMFDLAPYTHLGSYVPDLFTEVQTEQLSHLILFDPKKRLYYIPEHFSCNYKFRSTANLVSPFMKAIETHKSSYLTPILVDDIFSDLPKEADLVKRLNDFYIHKDNVNITNMWEEVWAMCSQTSDFECVREIQAKGGLHIAPPPRKNGNTEILITTQ